MCLTVIFLLQMLLLMLHILVTVDCFSYMVKWYNGTMVLWVYGTMLHILVVLVYYEDYFLHMLDKQQQTIVLLKDKL